MRGAIMRGAIMQPTYLPWLGYFSMIDDVDVFVFLDSVQLVKRSWQVRNRIKEYDGKELMLSIPIHTIGRRDTKICDAEFASQSWYVKHLNSIKQCYSKSKFYDEIMSFIEPVYYENYKYLSEFNIKLITSICEYIGINTTLIKSSDLNGICGKKDSLLVDICKKIGIDYYLSAIGSSEYIESKEPGGFFSKEGIKLRYQNYQHPEYKQLGNVFMPFMGIIDLLCNNGKTSLEIIKSGKGIPYKSSDIRKI